MSEEPGAKRQRKVEWLFHQARARSREEREKFLAENCWGDESLRREVESLLSHYDENSPLDGPLLPRLFDPAFSQDQSIGRYKVIRQLGRGGMGEVYLARDLQLPRKVAIKILPREFTENPELNERLRREAQTASALNHPNILTIYEFGEDAGVQYMASEFVEGTELRALIGRLSQEKVLDYARQIGQALAAAHSVGIVHRDIKPENIMVRADGYVKVLDFGLAKLSPWEMGDGQSVHQRLSEGRYQTSPGMVVGTISYMSPEQLRGEEVDRRTDIWSWGVVLYEMVAGRRPFDGATPTDVLAAIGATDPHPPSRKGEINRIVTTALKPDPEDRYQSMPEALQALPAVPQPRWVNRAITLIACVLILAACIPMVLWSIHKIIPPVLPPPPPIRIARMIPLTTSGNVIQAAISPDGNYVAYVIEDNRGQALKIAQIEPSNEEEKFPATKDQYSGLTFSPDGRFLYYVVVQNFVGALYRVAVRGQQPTLVANDVDSAVSFSPDKNQIVFVRNSSRLQQSSLVIKSLTDRKEVAAATVRYPEQFLAAPAWSADTDTIVADVYKPDYAKPSIRFLSLRVYDNTITQFDPQPWSWVGRPVLIRNTNAIVAAATSIYANGSQLVEFSLANGKFSAVTADMEDYRDLDVTAASDKILSVVVHRESNLWVVPLGNPTLGHLVTSGRYFGVTWTPSGNVISQSDAGGQPDLRSIDVRTGKERLITDDKFMEQTPVVSPDEKYVVYASNRDGSFHLWRTDLDGSTPVQLTSGASRDWQPTVTPDGRSIIYTSNRNGFDSLWKISMNGGEPVQLTGRLAKNPELSPDGRLILCLYADLPPRRWSVALLNASDGQPVRLFPNLPDSQVRWLPNGEAFVFIETVNGVSNIWKQSIHGGSPTEITHFNDETIFAVAPSPDGKSLGLIRGRKSSNVVIAQIAGSAN